MSKSAFRLVSPATENRTVERSMPSRRPNADIRPREHLTEREVEKLIAAARGNRWGQRDATMILIAFRHGLRASELCELQWSDDGDNGEENLIHPGKCPDSFLGSTALQKLKILDRKPRNLRRVIDAGLADLNDFFRDYLCKRVVTVN